MNGSLGDFVNLPYSIEVVPDQTTDGSPCYMASNPELPGCMSHGDSPEEAITNLIDARRLYIETLLAKGKNVPLPTSSPMAIWEIVTPVLETETEAFSIIPGNVNPIQSSQILV